MAANTNTPAVSWDRITAECFRQDDGSLPGVFITNLSSRGVSAIYAMLRSRSTLEGNTPEFWSRMDHATIHVDAVPDAALLVTGGQAEAFHHCIRDIRAGDVELPTLGVFVYKDAIELDYRMGSDWGPAQVCGLFALLKECCALDAGALVKPAENEGPPNPVLFAEAWASYFRA